MEYASQSSIYYENNRKNHMKTKTNNEISNTQPIKSEENQTEKQISELNNKNDKLII